MDEQTLGMTLNQMLADMKLTGVPLAKIVGTIDEEPEFVVVLVSDADLAGEVITVIEQLERRRGMTGSPQVEAMRRGLRLAARSCGPFRCGICNGSAAMPYPGEDVYAGTVMLAAGWDTLGPENAPWLRCPECMKADRREHFGIRKLKELADLAKDSGEAETVPVVATVAAEDEAVPQSGWVLPTGQEQIQLCGQGDEAGLPELGEADLAELDEVF